MSKEISLSNGGTVIVDDEDHEWLSRWSWFRNKDGYAVRNAKNSRGILSRQHMHRLIMQPPDEYGTGPSGRLYPKHLVDHRDGNKLNNQRSNLRICTHAESLRNRQSFRTKTSSIYKGVFLDKKLTKRPWKARINLNGKKIHLGMFATEVEAAIAYNEAAVKYHGEFARLNEIPPDLSSG